MDFVRISANMRPVSSPMAPLALQNSTIHECESSLTILAEGGLMGDGYFDGPYETALRDRLGALLHVWERRDRRMRQ